MNTNRNQPQQPSGSTPPPPPGYQQSGQFQGLGQAAHGGQPQPNVYQAQNSEQIWREKYEKAQKRSRILAGTTAAACVLAVGAGIWGMTKSSGGGRPDFANGQGFPSGGMGGEGGFSGGGPGGQGGPGQMFSNLFNSDGSVNTDQLSELKSRLPDGLDIDDLIDRAQQSGSITSEQAQKLKDALNGSSTNSSSYTGAATYGITSVALGASA